MDWGELKRILFFDQVVDSAAFYTGLSGVALFLKPVRQFFRDRWVAHRTYRAALRVMPALVGQLVVDMTAVKKELQPNGGASMRDAIDIANARILAMLQDSSVSRFEADANGHVTFVNQEFARRTGLAAEMLTDNGWINAVSAAERMQVFDYWRACVAQRRYFQMRINLVQSDGTEWPAIARSQPLRDDDGKIVGWAVTIDSRHSV